MKNSLLLVALLCGVATTAARGQTNPASLPAKDTHDGVTISADPYQEEARYKEHFGKKNPLKPGILALEVFIRNDNDKPLRLNLQSVRLMLAVPGAEKQRLRPLAVEEVLEEVLSKGGPKGNAPRPRIPMPGRVPS